MVRQWYCKLQLETIRTRPKTIYGSTEYINKSDILSFALYDLKSKTKIILLAYYNNPSNT